MKVNIAEKIIPNINAIINCWIKLRLAELVGISAESNIVTFSILYIFLTSLLKTFATSLAIFVAACGFLSVTVTDIISVLLTEETFIFPDVDYS